jgi:hypothetical protein
MRNPVGIGYCSWIVTIAEAIGFILSAVSMELSLNTGKQRSLALDGKTNGESQCGMIVSLRRHQRHPPLTPSDMHLPAKRPEG